MPSREVNLFKLGMGKQKEVRTPRNRFRWDIIESVVFFFQGNSDADLAARARSNDLIFATNSTLTQ